MTREEALAVLENIAWLGKGEDIVLEALSVLKAIPDVVYCKDCIHRPVLKYNGFDEWVEAPMRERITSKGRRWEHDYTCPYVCGDMELDRRPLGHLFCSFGERA